LGAKEKNYIQFVGTKLPLSKHLTYFPTGFQVKSFKFRRDKNLKGFVLEKMANIALENCFFKVTLSATFR